MATVSLTTSSTTLDAGSSDNVSITNTGTVDVVVTRGTQTVTLHPTQSVVIYPEGTAVTAVTSSGSGQVTATAAAKPLPNAADPTTLAANAAFTSTYGRFIGASNGTNDTTAIQALLTAARVAGGGLVKGTPGTTYFYTQLVIGAGTTLDMTGCIVKQIAGTNQVAVTNYSRLNPVLTDSSSYAYIGSNSCNSTAIANGASLGQTVVIAGAGGGPSGLGPLVGNINQINTGAGTFALETMDGRACAAHKNVTPGAVFTVYNRDSNITIRGGSWDFQNNHGPTYSGSQMRFTHVDNLRIDVDRLVGTGVCRGVNISSARNYWVSVTRVDMSGSASVGVQINGPAAGGRVDHLAGYTTDDLLSFTAGDYIAEQETAGDIVGCTVGTVVGAACGGVYFVKVIAGVGWYVDAIKVDGGIFGTAVNNGISLGNDELQAVTTGGTYGEIDLGLVTVNCTGGSPVVLVNPAAQLIKVNIKPPNSTYTPIVTSGAIAATINTLKITGAVVGTSLPGVFKAASNITINHLVLSKMYIENLHTTNTFASVSSSNTTAVITRCTFDHCRQRNYGIGQFPVNWLNGTLNSVTFMGGEYLDCQNLFNNDGATAAVAGTDLTFTGCKVTGVTGRLATLKTGTSRVALNGPHIDNLGLETIATTGATITVVGNYIGTLASGSFNSIAYRTASQTVRVNGSRLPVDVSILSGAATGDMAYNNNAANACGLGLVEYDGTAWRSVRNGGAAKIGTATLAGGTVTVADTAITANSVIRLAYKTIGGTPGAVYVSAKSAGTSFTITSTSNTDTSVIQYYIDVY